MAGILTAAVASIFSGVTADPYFEYTTLLLPGNGTNGAQNNTFLDSSTNNFTITRNGNTTQGTFSPFSQTGWGNYFDGTGDFLSVASTSSLGFGTGDFTIELWTYVASTSNIPYFFDCRTTATANEAVPVLYINGGNYEYYVSGAARITVGAVPTNQWVHVALVRNSGTTTLYSNGTSTGTWSDSTNYSSCPMVIGQRKDTTSQSLTGYISNFRVVKGTAVYTSAFTPPTAPLTAISGTSLLTCQSNRFIDNSSNNFTITRNGDTSVVAFSPFNPSASWSAATYGGSGYFDGSGDYLSAPASNITDFATGQAFTFECWFYTTLTAYQSLIRSTNGFFCDFTGTSVSYGKAGVAFIINVAATVNLNQWNHFAVSRNTSNQSRLWLNGVTAGSNSSDTYSFSNDSVIIGLAAGSYLSGYISGMRVVKGTAVYDPTQTSITVPTAPLTAITNTSLLLNFTNAGVYDATSKNDLETVGDAQISNTTAKWGSTSIKFDGTGDSLITSPSIVNSIGTGDFTIEFWCYPTNTTAAYRAIVASENYNSTAGGWSIYQNGTGIEIYLTSGAIVTAASQLVASTWQHIALVRSGSATNNCKLYVNGTNVASATNTADWTGQRIFIGDNNYPGTDYFFNGYIQDLRITKGYARYTTNFTAPTAAFPTL